ncbi:hypothetical protein Ahy_A04g021043 [Arachis hypogaea]|uniref:PB1-like domain-containing protein n=1 Tax=Arachis hypogaea TaxID=3818 RepID=A0A445DJ71_ARAHY|nr:hypothetical protein Ahy_A04g021043 [Arachis hypogaea]
MRKKRKKEKKTTEREVATATFFTYSTVSALRCCCCFYLALPVRHCYNPSSLLGFVVFLIARARAFFEFDHVEGQRLYRFVAHLQIPLSNRTLKPVTDSVHLRRKQKPLLVWSDFHVRDSIAIYIYKPYKRMKIDEERQSHELRTPMAAIIGLLDILMSDDCLINEQCATVLSPLKDGIIANWDIVDNIWDHAFRFSIWDKSSMDIKYASHQSSAVVGAVSGERVFVLGVVVVRVLQWFKRFMENHPMTFVFHHGGKFKNDESGSKIYEPDNTKVLAGVEGDTLDVFFVKEYYKELGYSKVDGCCWKVPRMSLEVGLRKLEVNADLLKMVKDCRRNHNSINIYFVHRVSEPHIVECMSEDDDVLVILETQSTSNPQDLSLSKNMLLEIKKEPVKETNVTRTGRVVIPAPFQEDLGDGYESSSDSDSGVVTAKNSGSKKYGNKEKSRPASHRSTDKAIDTDDSSYEDIEDD